MTTTTLLRMEFYPIQCVESMMMVISFRLNMLRVEDALEDDDDDANRILSCISRYDDGLLNCFLSQFIERTRYTCSVHRTAFTRRRHYTTLCDCESLKYAKLYGTTEFALIPTMVRPNAGNKGPGKL